MAVSAAIGGSSRSNGFWPICAASGPSWVEFGRFRASIGQIRPQFVRTARILSIPGEFGQGLPSLSESWGGFGPMSAVFGPIPDQYHKDSARFGPCHPELARLGLKSGCFSRICTTFVPKRYLGNIAYMCNMRRSCAGEREPQTEEGSWGPALGGEPGSSRRHARGPVALTPPSRPAPFLPAAGGGRPSRP